MLVTFTVQLIALKQGFSTGKSPDIWSFIRAVPQKNLVPFYGQVYNFENIRDAVDAQDEGKINGKIVVRVSRQNTGTVRRNDYQYRAED